MTDADGGLALERFRSYLLLIARLHVGARHQAKFDASDVVQQTLLVAHRQRAQFRGSTAAELAAWLRKVLATELADAIRGLERARRDVRRERALEQMLAEVSSRLEACLPADQSSPSE